MRATSTRYARWNPPENMRAAHAMPSNELKVAPLGANRPQRWQLKFDLEAANQRGRGRLNVKINRPRPLNVLSSDGGLAGNRQRWWMCERLVHNTVPFGQAQEGGKLLFRSIGVERELQPDILKADGYLL